MAPSPRRPGTPRWREFAWLLLAGAGGAAVVLFCAHRPAARVIVFAPRPLPDTITTLTLADLRPAVAALAIAVLASLAAAAAMRRVLRRIVALITVALGTGMALLTVGGVTRAEALAAATRSSASPAPGSGAGSVTAGTGGGSAGGPIVGLPTRVLLVGDGWRWLLIAGVALIILAAVAIVIRADHLPEMSRRYGREASQDSARRPGTPADSAVTLWESLSAGADPTAWPDENA